MEELQSWWEIPSIGQYVSLFRFAFGLPEMEIEELEEGLIADGTPGGSPFLINLIVSLLRGIHPRSGVNEDNWELHLSRQLNKYWVNAENPENPLPAGTLFSTLTLRTKVEILYFLCLHRLDRNDVIELMKSMDAETLRVQSLGCDDQGNVYWYFYGTRLYKEEPSVEKKQDWKEVWRKQKKESFGRKKRRGRPRKCKSIQSDGESDESEEPETNKSEKNGFMNVDEKSRWSIVCTTLEEWVNFTEKFKNSKSKCEMSLFKILSSNFLPHLHDIYEEKEKKLKEKMMELIPRRLSTRIETKKRVRVENNQSDYYYGDLNLSDDTDDNINNRQVIAEKKAIDRGQRLEERNQRRIITQMNLTGDRNSVFFQSNDGNDVSASSNSNVIDRGIHAQILHVLTEVKMSRDAWPFLYPVEESYAPGYYSIIKEPMDLSTIEANLENGRYGSIGDVENDMRKMVSNSMLYNGKESDFTFMAQTLYKIFKSGVRKIVQTIPNPRPAIERVSAIQDQYSPDGSENCYSSSENSDRTKSSAGGPKKKRKKSSSRLKALDMLAQASEIALKNVHGETANYSEDSSSRDSAFPDLNILPLESTTSSKSNSPTHDVANNSYDSSSSFLNQVARNPPQFTSQTFNNNLIFPSPSNAVQNSETFNLLSEHANNSFRSPTAEAGFDVSEVTLTGNLSPTFCNQKYNGINSSLSNILDDCNSDLISKFIKENQSYQLNNEIKPQKSRSISNSPQNTHSMLNNNLETNSYPSNDMSTIDASAIGISTFHNYYKKPQTYSTGNLDQVNKPAQRYSPVFVNTTTSAQMNNMNYSVQAQSNMPQVSTYSVQMNPSNQIVAPQFVSTASQIPLQFPTTYTVAPQLNSMLQPRQVMTLSMPQVQNVATSANTRMNNVNTQLDHNYLQRQSVPPVILEETQLSPTVKKTNISCPPKKRSPHEQSKSPPTISTLLNMKNNTSASNEIRNTTTTSTLPSTNSAAVVTYSNGEASRSTVNGQTFCNNVVAQNIPIMQQLSNIPPGGTVHVYQKVGLQNGTKQFRPATLMRNANGQYVLVPIKDNGNIPARPYVQTQQNVQVQNNFNDAVTNNVMTTLPQFVGQVNPVIQSYPVRSIPVKTMGVQEVPGQHLSQILNIPQMMMTTQQNSTMLQQPSVFAQGFATNMDRGPPMGNA